MRVSAEIKTGDHRVIEYLLSPVMQAVKEAGREKEMNLTRLSTRGTRKGIRRVTSSFRPTGNRLSQICLDVIMPAVLAALISILLCSSSPSIALEAQSGDDFIWQRDKLTGIEIAASQSDPSLNFFDVGDLSIYSLYLVEQVLGDISNATGGKVDRSLKKSSIAIFHDTNVFSRLKTEGQSFTVLGIPDDVIDSLKRQITDDAKCISTTRTDDKNNVVFTVILLSEKFNDCLIGGLNNSFGLRSLHINIRTLINACVLYEGRRLGLRDRQSLSQETPRLRELCLAKAGETK